MENIKQYPERPKTPSFILGVNHFVQGNNTGGEGYRECNLGACAMLGDYLLGGIFYEAWKAGKIAQPEDSYATVLAKHGDTTDHEAQTRALLEFGIKSYFTRQASLNMVAQSLFLGVPVVLGNKYKAGGHMTLAVGRDAEGFSVMCPYGIRNGSSDSWHEIFTSEQFAKTDHFSWSILNQVVADLGPDAVWARIVTHVNGVPTGLK